MRKKIPILLILLVAGLALIVLEIMAPDRPGIGQVTPAATATQTGLPRPVRTLTATSTTAPSIATTLTTEVPGPTRTASVTPTPGPSDFFVAPDGSEGGDGSREKPWDLETALNGPASVRPGDTIWVRGGSYNYRHQDYLYVRVDGEEGAPVIIRAVPGERAFIDSAVSIRGDWTTLWGLEILDTSPNRLVGRKNGLIVRAAGVKLINNIIHDTNGVDFWYQAVGSEMYGNLIYNNGWLGTDRGHGHGVYTDNDKGTKLIADNIIFNNYSGYNIHAYSEKTYLNNFRFEGNVSFNGRFLVGGAGIPARNIELFDNFFYRSAVRLGHRPADNQDLWLSGNVFHAVSEPYLTIQFWKGIHGASNTAWVTGLGLFSAIGASELASAEALTDQRPDGVQVYVRPNAYETGRGHVIIYNWAHLDSVDFDLSGLGLEPGQRYRLHNAQNFFDEVIEGEYNGKPVQIPMTGWTAAIPTGEEQALNPVTLPEFGVFVVERIAPEA